MTTFDRAFEFLMGHEVLRYGKSNQVHYTNDPDDPGGETNWGISAKYNPGIDIKNLTKEGAKAIAKAKYWDKLRLDNVTNPEVAIKIFDTYFGPMSGIAVLGAQLALRRVEPACVEPDGKMGPKTIAALNRLCDDKKSTFFFLVKYCEEILKYTKKHTKPKYWDGHIRRALDLPELENDHW
jgi:lysozyme family protein